MTISTGEDIDAADLNTLYNQLQVGLNDRDGAKGTNNKYRKTSDWMHVFHNVTAEAYDDFSSTHWWTPRVDIRLLGMSLAMWDSANTPTVSMKLTPREVPEDLTPPVTLTEVDDAKFFLMNGVSYEISGTAGNPTTYVHSSNLTRDATNGDANELVLFGGVTYQVSIKLGSTSSVSMVLATLTFEHAAMRFAKT